MKKGKTKLKFTVASFTVHVLLALGFYISSAETLLWAAWFTSFNTTLAIYTTTKTFKDKILMEHR